MIKPIHILFALLGTAVTAYVLFYVLSTVNQSPIQIIDGRPVKKICTETVASHFNQRGDAELSVNSTGECTSNLQYISRQYIIKDGNVYWLSQTTYNEKPCISGTGDMSAFVTNMTSLECWRSKPQQINQVEERHLEFVAKHSTGFHSLEGSAPNRPDWQQEKIASYAKNETSVYFEGKKIEQANPRDFSVIFPFGDDEKWQKFNVSQNNDQTFIEVNSIGNIDLTQFQPLAPVSCPGHGLASCSHLNEEGIDSFLKYGNWGNGVLGKIGHDIIFLRPDGVNTFRGMDSPDLFMFASSRLIYLYTNKKFYELEIDKTNPSNTKFINMNIPRYENFK